MKLRERILCLVLAVVMLLAFSGCGPAAPAETTGTTAPTTAPTVPAETTAPTAPTEPPVLQTVWVWTEQTYTAVGSVGSLITHTYDQMGNLIMDNYASNDGKVSNGTNYTYDASGKILTQDTYEKYDTQNITCHTEYTYDAAGRVIAEAFSDNQGNTGRVEYTYREDGQLAEKVLYQGKTEDHTVYTYNDGGKLVKQEQTLVAGEKSTLQSWVDYTYDEQGNKLSETDNAGFQKLWTYNEQGKVLTYQELDKTGYLMLGTAYEYDEPNRIIIEYPYKGDMENPLEKYIYEHDEAGRLAVKYICTPNSNRINASQFIHYTYDENGNLLTEICTDKKGSELSRREYTYISMEIPVK